MEEVMPKEALEAAQSELNSIGGNHVDKLAKVLCILLSGMIERALEEYEDEG